ncbi:MAG TPA: pantetheine-phosphate adenylyltransferase [Oscillospiraceae bacterium]|nr:pantetheine-phosphate adenylyltransferase [Oscillospiraceae bacterium]HPF55528.1 pantetheine-phosphate adenylyltransferase [Clostridiales bacterium]HPK35698.1 pantetheine-phosphate adenylyltransferase [Oscillospiraceae bacterium]HPR76391.1 pantetheine-phosphate adenylyltransferase [Oscillospiraceae bacterium]
MKKIAICPGSFDPVTYGHIDIIRRAASLFDEVIVVVANNPDKKRHFTAQQRLEFLKESLSDISNVSVDVWDGLTAEYARKVGAAAIVRGLRAMTDFENEFQLALTNKKLYPDGDTVFLTTKLENLYMSSSMVRQLAGFGGDTTEFVPPCVSAAFKNRGKNK